MSSLPYPIGVRPTLGVGRLAFRPDRQGDPFKPDTVVELPARPAPQPEPVEPPPVHVDPPLPSTLKMAGNLLQSVGRNLQAAVTGNPLLLSEEDKEARLAICRLCQHYRKVDDRCALCGCKTAVKAYLRIEKCPVGKW